MPRPVILVSALAIAGCSLLAAGCGGGGSGSPAVANVGSTTSSTPAAQSVGLVAYAQCMRSHGVPTFPGPSGPDGGLPKPAVIAASQANPSKFASAQTACQHLQPNSLGPPQTAQQQATQRLDALSFAKCMRSHGVARFPDPTSQGQLTVEMVEAQGIDVHSPAVLHVVQACLPASHGLLTPAKVAEAIGNAGG